MHCTACGTNLGEHWRCPQCKHVAHGLSLNLYSVALIVPLVVTNWINLRYLAPIVVNLFAGLGVELSLAFRVYLGLSYWGGTWAWVLLVVIALFLVVTRKTKILRSGRLLAVAAWLLLLYTLAGVLSGYVTVLTIPSLVK